MRTLLISMTALALLELNTLCAQDKNPDSKSIGQQIREAHRLESDLAQQRKDMVRVTTDPHFVPSQRYTYCVPPGTYFNGPHADHWLHVYITPAATNTIMTGKGTYPAGTVILKQKFNDAEAKKTELYTGMRKRERGYNPEAGDWEFFTLKSDGKSVTTHGKLESCIDCHTTYSRTDFVSREYLKTKPATTK